MELGIGEILVILVVVLLLFGPSKLPQLGEALGRGIRNFRKATSEKDDSPQSESPTEQPPAELPQGSSAPRPPAAASVEPASAAPAPASTQNPP